jgi:hypothetical protein
VRCLDASSALHYAPVLVNFDLTKRNVAVASLSDDLRILVLHEFGGVWVDATLFCNRPLDEWLPGVFGEGFFAFDTPDHGCLWASWFLPAEPGRSTIAGWARAVEECWWECAQADQYLWFHRLFRRICEADPAPGSDCLLRRLIGHEDPSGASEEVAGLMAPQDSPSLPPRRLASLSVSTENLGDHIQIVSGLDVLSRFGLSPEIFLDRAFALKSAPGSRGASTIRSC